MKKRVAILSVLKPVDDPRMFEKISPSLVELEYDVHIYGFPSQKENLTTEHIHLHPHTHFSRLSLRRFLIPILLLVEMVKLKPSYIVVNSIDFQLHVFFYRVFTNAKIVYDVRENYFRNILYQRNFYAFVRIPLAFMVRALELINWPFYHHFMLAEYCYKKQLKYLPKRKSSILPNRIKPPKNLLENKEVVLSEKNELKFCLTGTLSKEYMTLECIDFFEDIQRVLPNATLYIAGYAGKEKYREGLKQRVSRNERIQAKGIDHLVPHEDVLRIIEDSDVGFCFNDENKSYSNKIPTKVYEYLGLRSVILHAPDRDYFNIVDEMKAGIPISIGDKNRVQKFISAIDAKFKGTLYSSKLFWGSDENRWLSSIFR